ncbi:MAG: hypothetical protein AAF799_18205 [Myxococcota bacterium]
MSTAGWDSLMKVKGAAWFGTEVEATVHDAANYREISWTPGVENSHGSRDHVRLKYSFEVDGQTYQYPYEDGFVEVKPEQVKPTIAVTYWDRDPKRNHPVGKDYKFGDQMTGFVFGLLISLTALLMAISWVRGLVRPAAVAEQAG